jgi:hypothetical protein
LEHLMGEEGSQQPQAEPQGDADARQEPDYRALWEQAKADARKWEGRAKEANSKALDEANARLADVQAERDALAAEKERREAVERVAGATGVPASVVGSLSGASEEELTRQAEGVRDAMSAVAGRAYPQTRDRGETQAKAITADDIRAIKDPHERILMRARHRELFER